ncbi:MAG TPA: glycosyltransferase family 1 protein [Bryobacteraceae bacterium]|nr:glycosyltransferase family 1 protein [Bryobacteraceae bacterium]
MKISIDATYSTGRDLSGVGVYSRELMEALAAAHQEARFLWCYRLHRLARGLREPHPGNTGRRPLLDWLAPPGDLFHGLNQRLPRRRARRTVCTFHDLFVLTGDYSTPEFRARFAEQARHAAAEADRIIAVSGFTALQVEELLGVERSRIRVVHHGVRALPRPEGTAREKVILHVGAVQKRKNIARLVEAFEQAGSGWRLVLAGSAGYGAEEILARIENSPARERILTPGYVSAGELARWYGRAAVFAFPSLDEGFGIPVLEAMAAGAAVLGSARAAIPEVAGDAALLVNPEDTGDMAAALEKLIRDEPFRRELGEKGRRRAAEFTWERAATATWSVYAELLAS